MGPRESKVERHTSHLPQNLYLRHSASGATKGEFELAVSTLTNPAANALNAQQFFATNLRLLVYPQPSTFTQAALNTTDLGLGPPKFFGVLVGAPIGFHRENASADAWIRGQGFLAFQNASTALSAVRLRCRWGAVPGAPASGPGSWPARAALASPCRSMASCASWPPSRLQPAFA
jgi:hypothetical protein